MKLTAFILLTACLTAGAAGKAQTIKLDVKDAPLERVFTQIKKQAGYSFVYYKEDLAKTDKITLRLTSSNIEEVLQQVLKGQPLSYTIVDKTVVIKQKEKSPNDNGVIPGHDPESIPPIDITGRVTDPDGNPLSGASVKVKGSSLGTTTNADGVFVLKGVDDNTTLEISFVGYETYTVAANNPRFKPGDGKSSATIALKVKPENLNEVIINKGYYTEKQRLSVSNVGKITAKDIEKQPVQNPILALQGRVAGITIVQNNGLPGGGVTVRIQGSNSIGGVLNGSTGNDPLYVIDGVPYVSQNLTTTIGAILGTSGSGVSGNPLSYINPSDIESIEILKDANATSIYGSRAANGAILITTKKGRQGPLKTDFNFQYGIGNVARRLDLLNTQQYLTMRREAFLNDGVPLPSIATNPNDGNYDVNGLWDTTRYTDWQKTLIGNTAHFSNYQLSFSGGTNITQYNIAGTYNRMTDVFPGDFADSKTALSITTNSASSNQRFQVQFSGMYLHDDNGLPAADFTSQVFLAPNAPALYNSDGTLNWQLNPSGNSSWGNPMAATLFTYDNKTNNLIGNIQLKYKINSFIEARVGGGYTNLQTNELQVLPRSAMSPENRISFTGEGRYSNSRINSWIAEPQLEYKKKLGKGDLNFLIGSTFQKRTSDGEILIGNNYDNDAVIRDKKAAATIKVTSTIANVYKYAAAFGRLYYNWREKYLIDLTARRDGSSRFGPENRFHNFGSIGVGWIFTEEPFIKNNLAFLNLGKLRGNFGTTGNDQIGDYTFMNLYNIQKVGVPYQGLLGRLPGALYDPYLAWEETKKFQVGLDLGFLKNRIQLTTNYVRNRSSNQLLGYSLPTMTGFSTITTNFPATVQNTAIEFLANTLNINKSKFKWRTNFNITVPRNELVEFPNLSSSAYAALLFIGQPIGAHYEYHFFGVNPATGKFMFADQHGNPTSNPNYSTDRTVLLNEQPKYYGGLQNSLEYKNLELDFLFQFARQMAYSPRFLGSSGVGKFYSGLGNDFVGVLDRWQKSNDLSSIERFTQTSIAPPISDADFADGSFVKLKNVAISYHVPMAFKNKLHAQDFRVYLHGQNLLTLTKYPGFDPEIQTFISLPPLRVITFGAQITF